MKSKIPPDAFDQYVAQGAGRSYQATADHFGVSKCAVAKKAKKHDWKGRLAAIEGEARAASDKKLAGSLGETHDRHIKLLRAMGMRVATALRDLPLKDCMDAMRSAEIVMRMERMIAGEVSKPSEHTFEDAFAQVQALVKFERVPDAATRAVESAVKAGTGNEEKTNGKRIDGE